LKTIEAGHFYYANSMEERTVTFFRCIFWSLFFASSISSAAEYELDGHIEQKLYNGDGTVELLKKSEFAVFMRDCSWLIETTDLDQSGGRDIMRQTGCANGKEIYEVEGRLRKQNHNGVRDWNMATIVSNNVPVGLNEGYSVGHLWQMFASGCYFASLSTNWLTPVYDVNASVMVDPSLKREAKWNLIDGPGSLPLSVVYLEGGLTNATYVATGITNSGAIKVPNGFIFEIRIGSGYAPGLVAAGGAAPAYRIRASAVATVTAVKPNCSRRDFMPGAEGRTVVTDLRLTNLLVNTSNLPGYVVPEGVQWRPVAEARKSYITRQGKPTPPSRGVVFLVLLFPSAIFMFFLWAHRRKR
jgi:hypothetical protein